MIKTIDLTNMLDQQRVDDTLRNYKTNSSSSKQSVSVITGSQNSLQKKFIHQKNPKDPFPMTPDDLLKYYGK